MYIHQQLLLSNYIKYVNLKQQQQQQTHDICEGRIFSPRTGYEQRMVEGKTKSRKRSAVFKDL